MGLPPELFTDSAAARGFFEARRWPGGQAACPHCGSQGRAYRLKIGAGGAAPREGVWKCGQCRRQFTVFVGTSLEHTHLEPGKFLLAIDLLCRTPQPQMRELALQAGLSPRSAVAMTRRLQEVVEPGERVSPWEAVDRLLRAPKAVPDALERLDREAKLLERRLGRRVPQRRWGSAPTGSR